MAVALRAVPTMATKHPTAGVPPRSTDKLRAALLALDAPCEGEDARFGIGRSVAERFGASGWLLALPIVGLGIAGHDDRRAGRRRTARRAG
ncbi:hypothetical protein [Pseudonocardia nigra]|uniref:hypothetical protein n=1 Tax=Pseudonocardia nigra TaxID=1921578 RepID=UPI001C5FF420|nr:hypothetical protein [Pseudonocardia nigra]